MKEKLLFSWSSGKDSGFALNELKRRGRHEVVGLITTVTEGYDRVSMHGVRDGLLAKQAEKIGMCLERVYIPQEASN
jgi:diphthamide synthase (EF-2-diphthine--ammonia ligase)